MSGMASLLAGAGAGLSIAMPFGPTSMLLVERTLADGLKTGVASGLAIATVHLTYATAALWGGLALFSRPENASLLSLASGLLLLYFACRLWRREPVPRFAGVPNPAPLASTGRAGNELHNAWMPPAGMLPKFAASYCGALGFGFLNPLTPALCAAALTAFAGPFLTNSLQPAGPAAIPTKAATDHHLLVTPLMAAPLVDGPVLSASVAATSALAWQHAGMTGQENAPVGDARTPLAAIAAPPASASMVRTKRIATAAEEAPSNATAKTASGTDAITTGPASNDPVSADPISAAAITTGSLAADASATGSTATGGVLPAVTLPLVLGVFAGSLAWWVALTSTVAIFRHRLDPARLVIANRGAGLFLALLALTLVARGFNGPL